MSIPGSGSPLLFSADAAAPAAADNRSLRFNSADSAYLNKSFGSAGNQKTWTWSGWIKRTKLGTTQLLFYVRQDSSNIFKFEFTSSDTLFFEGKVGGTNTLLATTSRVFRDPSAWYHLVVRLNASSTEFKVYVNGVEETLTSVTGPSNQDYIVNSTAPHYIGGWTTTSNCDFYLAEVNFIDGSALDPTDFGEFDAITGAWNPIAYSGTYGTNGFHLDFADNSSAAALGYDAAGSNDWTVNNISVSDGFSTIATATGALPILNTDSTGATVQSGLRSDSNATYLKLAVVGGTASGLDLSDRAVSGRSASNASITNDGVTGTTSSSKFYSGSATVSNGNNFEVAAHGDFELGDTFTIEFWAKPDSSATGAEKTFIGYGINASNGYVIMLGQGGAIFRSNGTSDLTYTGSITDWSHFAFVANGGSSRKIFINGNLVASDSGTIDATGSYTTYIGSPDVFNSNFRFTGDFQDVRFYKGFAKYSSNFIAPNTYYASTAAGNDSLRDSPTNGDTANDTGAGGEVSGNYATWNPLDKESDVVLANGNLDITWSGVNGHATASTIAVQSGKWYWEITVGANASVGIYEASAQAFQWPGKASYSYAYAPNGNKVNNASYSSYGTAFSNGDIVGVAFDADNGKLFFSLNGTWQNSGDPAAGTNPAFSGLDTTIAWKAAIGYWTSPTSNVNSANFGQRAYNSTAPSGFKALCTANLDTPTIEDPSTVMDVTLYTGDGTSSQAITSLSFSPEFVWLKNRDDASKHAVFDIVRGATNFLITSQTDAETAFNQAWKDTYGQPLSLDTNGFTVKQGSDSTAPDFNRSTKPYVAYCWDAGTSNATNTSGSITSTVRANISAGFSIVTYTVPSSGTQHSVGHGLGIAPSLVICKDRNDGSNPWGIYHSALGVGKGMLFSTAAEQVHPTWWDNTNPTSSVFYLNSGTYATAQNSHNYVAYCFAPVEGYSAFGSYTGNGSSDGPFVYTGFRPKWILTKTTNGVNHWDIYDAARDSYNVADAVLKPNSSGAESTLTGFDLLSNGFKARGTDSENNGSGDTYIYAAFAENPFKYARAR